jgi:hypothetical protein
MTGKINRSKSNKRQVDGGAESKKSRAQKLDKKAQQILEQEIAHLEICLADLEARLPAHSIPPSMLAEIDELEEQLLEARAKLAGL